MHSHLRLLGAMFAITAMILLLTILPADAGDTPAGYWYGADGSGPGPVGSGVPYTMPTCGGAYGSYTGRIDSVPDSYNNVSYSNAANDNDNSGYGIGSQNYFVLTGPLSDPSYNGTDAEALAYGKSRETLHWTTG
jgi:hypothetical protein